MKYMEKDKATLGLRIAIIMPVYNEGKTIANTLSEIDKKIIKEYAGVRVIVFEDGSVDSTKYELSRLMKRYSWLKVHLGSKRLGYPVAVRAAFRKIDAKKFNYILFMDSDGQYDPADALKFIDLANKYKIDMVVGQRINRPEPFYRRFASFGLDLTENLMFGIGYYDVTSAFRLIKSEVGKDVADKVRFSKSNFWLEFSARSRIKNVSYATVKVKYRSRIGDNTSKVYSFWNMPKVVANEFYALVMVRFGK